MQDTATAFDSASHFLELPEVVTTKPTTLQAIDALLGHSGTWIVQTAKHREEGFRIFLQRIDPGGGLVTQLVIPDKVCTAIARQRQSVNTRSRKHKILTPEDRRRKRLAEARKLIRESRSR
jgi:hypothetical protein